jgi:hypothetical protein
MAWLGVVMLMLLGHPGWAVILAIMILLAGDR